MALADTLKHSASRKVGLVDLTGAIPLRQWTLDIPNAYYADVTGIDVAGVLQDGVEQELKASVLAVAVDQEGYYYDSALDRVYVHSPYDSTLVQVLAVYHIATHVKDFDSEAFARTSRLAGVPTIRLEISSEFGGTARTSSGSIQVVNNDALFDDLQETNFDAGGVTFKVAADLLR